MLVSNQLTSFDVSVVPPCAHRCPHTARCHRRGSYQVNPLLTKQPSTKRKKFGNIPGSTQHRLALCAHGETIPHIALFFFRPYIRRLGQRFFANKKQRVVEGTLVLGGNTVPTLQIKQQWRYCKDSIWSSYVVDPSELHDIIQIDLQDIIVGDIYMYLLLLLELIFLLTLLPLNYCVLYGVCLFLSYSFQGQMHSYKTSPGDQIVGGKRIGDYSIGH